MMRKRKRPLVGFTLVELLVVIAIIALLIAMTTPRLFRMIEEGRRTACRGNLRQIGIGMLLWAADRDGWMVFADGTWKAPTYDNAGLLPNQLPFTQHVTNLAAGAYVDDPRMWWCPSDKINGPTGNIKMKAATSFGNNVPPFASSRNVSYMYVVGYNVGRVIIGPSQAPLVTDESNRSDDGVMNADDMPEIGEDDNHGANFRNVVYVDGSVKAMEDSDAANAIFDPFGDTAEGRALARTIRSVD